MFFRRIPYLLILIAVEFGCQKKAAGPPPRYAIVRFENLTGDPDLEWMGRAASETLSFSLAGALVGDHAAGKADPVLSSAALGRLASTLGPRQPSAPGISSERAEARVAGANRLISGYIEREGPNLRIVAVMEDLTTGKTLRTVEAPSLSQLAHELSPRAKPYLTASTDAMRDYFQGLEASLETSQSDLARAVKLDPNFGPAWLSLVRLARLTHNSGEAETRVAEARTHQLDPLTLAELDSEAAALRSDEPARIAALRKIVSLSPGDLLLLRSLADTETAAGQFAAAAADWQKLAAELPEDAAIWNSLGYARSWAGDYPGALAALNEYRKLRPAEPNPLDSLGDLEYVNRKFKEAASYYLQAHAKDPNFLRSGELYKAAWAKFRAGDIQGADESFAQFHAAREKLKDSLLPLLTAEWLYRTGHPGDAMALLQKTAKETESAPLRAESLSQRAVWDLLEGNRAAAKDDGLAAGNPTNIPMLMARFAIEPSASPSEWQARADRVMSSSNMTQFRRQALGYALLLDGKRQAALPVWDEIVKATPATDFFSRAIDARLRRESGEKPLLPDPNNVNEFAALLDKL